MAVERIQAPKVALNPDNLTRLKLKVSPISLNGASLRHPMQYKLNQAISNATEVVKEYFFENKYRKQRDEPEVVDNLKQYLKDIEAHPVLPQKEQMRLAWVHKAGRDANEELSLNPQLSSDEASRLQKVVDEGIKARNALMESNLRMVVNIAKDYAHGPNHLPLLDLIQEGNLGMEHALNKFDPAKGLRVSNYAYWWIRRFIQRATVEQTRLIYASKSVQDHYKAFVRQIGQLTQELGREPTDSEVMRLLGVGEKRMAGFRNISKKTVSIETPIKATDGDTSIADTLADVDPYNDPAKVTELRLSSQDLEEILATALTPQEIAVTGLTVVHDVSLTESGAKLGISRSRVKQIRDEALKKLRQPEVSDRLRQLRQNHTA